MFFEIGGEQVELFGGEGVVVVDPQHQIGRDFGFGDGFGHVHAREVDVGGIRELRHDDRLVLYHQMAKQRGPSGNPGAAVVFAGEADGDGFLLGQPKLAALRAESGEILALRKGPL